MAITNTDAAAQLRSIADQLETEQPAAAETSSAPAAAPQTFAASDNTVTVQEGQSLQDIADKLDTDIAALHAYNAGLLGSNPAAPVSAGTVLAVPPTDAAQAESAASASAPADQAAAAAAEPAGQAAAPTVHDGDTAFAPAQAQGAPTDGQA